MEEAKVYVCYSGSGKKLGKIRLKSNSDDLRKIFQDNKTFIKQRHPGAAFIKLPKR